MSEPATALLPCPFCGGEARFSRSQDESLWSHNFVWWSSVGCHECDIQINECDDPDGADAAERWNTRADSQPSTSPDKAQFLGDDIPMETMKEDENG